ncbi:hypothetical protein SLE2022_361720 [Rubroshorea leprosula]
MASTYSPPVLQVLSVRCQRNAQPCSLKPESTKPSPVIGTNRRQLLFLVTAATALTAKESGSNAEDIPLFGLRKKLRSAEEEAVEIVKEGFEAAEKGLVTAERGIKTVERGIESAEKGLESAEKGVEAAVSFGGLAQAGVVAGAEVLGVVVATSVVNGILGPES